MSFSTCRAVPNAVHSTPSELWQDIVDRYGSAQAAKVATLTDTTTQVVTDGGVGFVLKVATILRDKPKPPAGADGRPKNKERFNPFLPPDPDLFVCHLTEGHSVVLNKFNIVPHHALVITREFHPQEEPLNAADFEATWKVMQSMPHGGLAYFNCGPVSGASQPHKHVQIIPLPLIEGTADAPPVGPLINAALSGAQPWAAGITQVDSFPFANFVAKIDALNATGENFASTHAALVERAHQIASQGNVDSSSCSFNLIMTREFMLLVPRRKEAAGPVSCNAMAFAGSFFVRSVDELEFIRKEGPMHILAQVGFPQPKQ